MYKFLECEKVEINEYNADSKKGHIFQTSLWCDFKSEWKQHYIKGVDNENNMVLSCALLTRKIPYLNKSIGYIPRGFVCDFKNKALVNAFSNFIKKYSKENGISFVTIDTDIHLKENENLVSSGEEARAILTIAGFSFACGKDKNFEAIQPNYAFRLDIAKVADESLAETKVRVFNNFHKKWKYKSKLGNQRHLEVEWYDNENVPGDLITEFHNIMTETGNRDNFLIRNRVYLENLIKKVKKHSRLYMVKYNLEADRNASIKKIEALLKDIDKLELKVATHIKVLEDENKESVRAKKMKDYAADTKKIDTMRVQVSKLEERIEKIDATGKTHIYLSGAIYLYYGNKAWYLYGASRDDFRDTMTNYTMQWAMIQDSIDLGLEIYDFRGVSGDLSEDNPLYGLYKFKKGFGGDFVQFLGECDLVVDRHIHTLFKEVFPRYKKIRAKVLNRGKK